MSGNPFRRSHASRLPHETTSTTSLPPDRSSTPPPPKSAKAKKRVVIQTPPRSPEEPIIPRRLSLGRSGSPPPPAGATRPDDDETDSPADLLPEQVVLNTQHNSGASPHPPTAAFGMPPAPNAHAGADAGGAPYNPFARTLATSEAAFGLQYQEETHGGRRGDAADGSVQPKPHGGGTGRPAMDVEAFKNILLTGSATPSPPVTHLSPPPRTQESGGSSSTDTSSVSKYSIFDQMHEAHPESPRTSFDDRHMGYPASDDGGDDDDPAADNEQSSLMGPVALRPVEEGPPPPPKHKHGRTYPQTVSFADFEESIPSRYAPAPAASATSTPHHDVHGILRPTLSRSSSDLNKPLPPSPADPPGNLGAVAEQRETNLKDRQPDHAGTETPPAAKKLPPPPPATRRPGQSGPGGRARSASNLSQGSSQYGDSVSSHKAADEATKAAPPPPPSRRGAQPGPNTPSPAPAETPQSLPAASNTASPTDSKPMPPPPPRRNPSKSGSTSAKRTPSTASRSSLPRNDSNSALAANAATHAPPAPPPRRGGFPKRYSADGPPVSLATRHSSATDYRRASGQSFESDRSVSLSSLQQVDEPQEEGKEQEGAVGSAAPPAMTEQPERDILADMSAFQAEIDALRAKGA